ncbi:hypothetical protein ACY2I4_002048 [Escherichia coli]
MFIKTLKMSARKRN